tara:strand:- start:795 stop:1202 length:408 start_codon:yes stop_codon:yes gene_type:complete
MSFPYLSRSIINYYDKLAEYYDISRRARGLNKPITTNVGFLNVYKKNSDAKKLSKCPVREDKPNGATWEKTRINRIKAKMGQMKSQNIPFFHESGELKGLPTKMHTILIMWAYTPYDKKIKDIKNKNLLKTINKV